MSDDSQSIKLESDNENKKIELNDKSDKSVKLTETKMGLSPKVERINQPPNIGLMPQQNQQQQERKEQTGSATGK